MLNVIKTKFIQIPTLSWSQPGVKIDFEVDWIFDIVPDRVFKPLGVDVGGLLGSKIGSKSVLQRRCTKTQKPSKTMCLFNVFWGSGWFNIDQKSIKNRCQNDFKMRLHFKSEKCSKNVPTWVHVDAKNHSKIHSDFGLVLLSIFVSTWPQLGPYLGGQLRRFTRSFGVSNICLLYPSPSPRH